MKPDAHLSAKQLPFTDLGSLMTAMTVNAKFIPVASRVDSQRISSDSRVRAAGCIAIERAFTDGRVSVPFIVITRCITYPGVAHVVYEVIAGLITYRRVPERKPRAGVTAEERILTFGGIGVGIASIRRWNELRLNRRRNRKPRERERDEQQT
jgi:hypothetical protein